MVCSRSAASLVAFRSDFGGFELQRGVFSVEMSGMRAAREGPAGEEGRVEDQIPFFIRPNTRLVRVWLY